MILSFFDPTLFVGLHVYNSEIDGGGFLFRSMTSPISFTFVFLGIEI